VELKFIHNLKNPTIRVALNKVWQCSDTIHNADAAVSPDFAERERLKKLKMLEIAPVKYVMVD